MAFQSSDGSKFTNRDTMKQHEARSVAKKQSPPKPQPQNDMSGMDSGADDPNQSQDGVALAQQHGNATHVAIDHTQGHHVSVQHPDGHSHESQHPSAEEAHDFGKDCATGAGGQAMGGGMMGGGM